MTVARGKIAVLTQGIWLYGTVNRREFAHAVSVQGVEMRRTFKLTKTGWSTGRRTIPIVGAHVASWDWQIAPVKRKRAAKPRRDPVTPRQADRNIFAGLPLSDEQHRELAADTRGLSEETVAMLCIAANVNSLDELTQASLPAFREALAAHMAGTVA
jgi:hypothetical protein